jgi:hypothetical protein
MNLMRLPKALSTRLLAALVLLLLAAVFGFGAPGARAANCGDEFTGAWGSNWSNAENWSTGAVPVASQDACVRGGIAGVEIGPGVSGQVGTIEAKSPVKIDTGASLVLNSTQVFAASSFDGVDVEGQLAGEQGISLEGDNKVEGQIFGPHATVILGSGTLAGQGTIGPRFIATGGTIQPGGPGAVGTLHFGVYDQDEGATLELDLASEISFDRVAPVASSNPGIAGPIVAHVLSPYQPSIGTTWEFIGGTMGVTNNWTVSPGEFSAHSVPGGAQLRLDSAIPTPPGGGGPEGGGAGGAGGGPTDTGTTGAGTTTGGSGPAGAGGPVAPGLTAAEAAWSGETAALMHACRPDELVITNLFENRHGIYVDGVAPASYARRNVQFLLDGGKVGVGTDIVASNGLFAASLRGPEPKADTTYVARLGELRTAPLPLHRRVVLERPRLVGGEVALAGRVTAPLADPPAPVTVWETTRCGTAPLKVATVKLGRGGAYRVRVPAPAGEAALFTVTTKVPRARGARPTRATSLAVPFLIGR